MWQCNSCEYLNEEIDEACQKCCQARAEAAEPGDQPAHAVPDEQGKPAAEQKEQAATNAVSILLIIACVLAIGAVGYLAWQRGLIGQLFPAGEPVAVTDTSVVDDLWADAPPAPAQFERKARPARTAIDDMLVAAANTAVNYSEDGALTGETDEALRDLAGLGRDLVWQYQEFENAVAEANDPLLGEYAQFVRDRFQQAMLASLEVTARAYSRDATGGHPAYLLSDEYVQAADNFGLIDTAELEAVWDSAVHARRQRELDRQYAGQYRELAARVAALEEIHGEFNAQLSAMPPYTVRSGVLGKDARDLLTLLGELADKIELMVIEFEDYRTGLTGLEPSDRMQEYIAQFDSLARTDHLYAFEEIYKLYEQDKELVHPVYTQVSGYYQFALDHWSESAMRYQEIYQASEVTWAMRWGNR
jgi:hypothetical protein